LDTTGDPPSLAALSLQVRPWLDDADAKVAVAAASALGNLRDPDAPALFRGALKDATLDVRVRQAILHALAEIEGTRAARVVIQQGANPLLTVDAIQILGKLKDPVALPFLRKIAKSHYNGYTRTEANKAIKLVEPPKKAKPKP